jgi:phosphatidylglycerophosphatase A
MSETPATPDAAAADAAAPADAKRTKSVAPAKRHKGHLGIIGHVATAIATLGPLGTRLPAPGTWGSAVGLLLYVAVFARYNNLDDLPHFLGLLVILAIAAILICSIAEKHIGKHDPGEVILDEVIAMPLVFVGAENFIGRTSDYAFLWFLTGFALFRFFDILKPFGIRKSQKLPSGLGIVIDDLLAAAVSCASLHVIHLIVKLFA